MANRYIFHSRISEAKFRHILRLFALDWNAVQIADLTRLSRVSINRYLTALRERMAWLCEQAAPMSGEIEVDESYFGARRVKGKRGRGAFGKTAVFGIYKRNGQVHAEIVPNCRKATLQAVIRGHVASDSTIYSDCWGGYDGLVDMGYRRHLRVAHGRGEWARDEVHINGIKGFWGYAKSRLAKFCGMMRCMKSCWNRAEKLQPNCLDSIFMFVPVLNTLLFVFRQR